MLTDLAMLIFVVVVVMAFIEKQKAQRARKKGGRS